MLPVNAGSVKDLISHSSSGKLARSFQNVFLQVFNGLKPCIFKKLIFFSEHHHILRYAAPLRVVDFTVQLCFRCKFSFHEP